MALTLKRLFWSRCERKILFQGAWVTVSARIAFQHCPRQLLFKVSTSLCMYSVTSRDVTFRQWASGSWAAVTRRASKNRGRQESARPSRRLAFDKYLLKSLSGNSRELDMMTGTSTASWLFSFTLDELVTAWWSIRHNLNEPRTIITTNAAPQIDKTRRDRSLNEDDVNGKTNRAEIAPTHSLNRPPLRGLLNQTESRNNKIFQKYVDYM